MSVICGVRHVVPPTVQLHSAGATVAASPAATTAHAAPSHGALPPGSSHTSPVGMTGGCPAPLLHIPSLHRVGDHSASRTTLAGAVPKELAAKFEKHKRDAGEAIAARKAAIVANGVASNAGAPPPTMSSSSSALGVGVTQAHQRSSSRPRVLKPGSRILEDLDNKRLLDLSISKQGHADVDQRSLSPRRSVARGAERLVKRRCVDDTLLVHRAHAVGGRQMFDKRTLRRRNKDIFRYAIDEWRSQHTTPGGKCRRSQGLHVAVRMRPIFEKDQQQGEFEVVSVAEEWGEVTVHNCLFHADLVRMFVHHSGFCFPRAFGATATNEDVYAECGWPLVSHALSGELGTLFMFGQTGSGKTYTMSAIMELAARDIFAAIGDRDEVAVRLKAFEVVGKKCFDLLPRQRTELKLLHDQTGRTHIMGAVEAPVPSAEECLRLLRYALACRATAGHARNDESSRSHCVCVLDLFAVGGSLVLVDCAGTERRQDSDHHSSERMRESAEINTSLHALKECIRYRGRKAAAKANGIDGLEEDEQRQVHVPYRDSQLTRVLHESFTKSGSYLAAIGCISPSSMDTEHTLSTLKTLQLLLSESGQSDAPNFEQRVDVDPKAFLRSSMLKRPVLGGRDHHRQSPARGHRASAKDLHTVPHHVHTEPSTASSSARHSGGDRSAQGLAQVPTPSTASSAAASAAQTARCLLTNRTLQIHQRTGIDPREGDADLSSGIDSTETSTPQRTPQPPPARLQKPRAGASPAVTSAAAAPGRNHAASQALHLAWETPPMQDAAEERQRSPEVRVRGRTRSKSDVVRHSSPGLSVEVDAAGAGQQRLVGEDVAVRRELERLRAHIAHLEEELRETRVSHLHGPPPPSPATSMSAQALEINADILSRLDLTESRAVCAENRAERAERRIEELEAKNMALEALFRNEQDQRRRSHNQLLDLKGNIRVFCRMRPLLLRELQEQGEDCVVMKRDAFTVEVLRETASVDGTQRQEMKAFQFDSVFGPSAQQAEVFREVEDLVQSAVDGYNVSIVAYGQTGAGKTYTMYGGEGEQQGVAARTIESIFELLGRMDSQRFGSTVRVNLVELYKNDLVDLLASQNRVAARLEVRRDAATGDTTLDGVEERIVTEPGQLLRLLHDGIERRATASTSMNVSSSRSHLFLTVSIEVFDREAKSSVTGKIRLCDLAGSERPKKSGAQGDVMREAIEINRALTALGDVIEALTHPSRKGGPVPYRNHKLTQLLSDSLGGSSKTLMFVNVSPAKSEVEETLNSLTYASRARNIVNDVRSHGLSQVRSSTAVRHASPGPHTVVRRKAPEATIKTMEDLADDSVQTLT